MVAGKSGGRGKASAYGSQEDQSLAELFLR